METGGITVKKAILPSGLKARKGKLQDQARKGLKLNPTNPYENLPNPQKDRISTHSRDSMRPKNLKALPPKAGTRNRQLQSANQIAPIDHAAATKKLQNILAQCTSSQSTHDDLIKSLPSFKDSKNTFVKHMKHQKDFSSAMPKDKLAYSMATNKHRGFSQGVPGGSLGEHQSPDKSNHVQSLGGSAATPVAMSKAEKFRIMAEKGMNK